MITLGMRIKERRKYKKYTQRDVAKAVRVSHVAISQWEKDENSPNGSNLQNLSNFLGCSANWLLTGKGDVEADTNFIPEPTFLSAPLISWVQAGAFCDTGDFIEIDDSTQFYPCPVKGSSVRTFALKVVGDSMTAPFPGMRSYPEGTIIFVDPDVTAQAGQRVIARIGNKTTFKQLTENENSELYLKPLNQHYPPIPPSKDMHVCGVVIGAFTPE